MAAFVQAATALVRAAVLSSHLSWAEGLAVGPTSCLNSCMSENNPAVLTSDCLILNFASADCKKEKKGSISGKCEIYILFYFHKNYRFVLF